MAKILNNANRRYMAFLFKNNRRYLLLYGFALLIAFPIFMLSLRSTISLTADVTSGLRSLYYVGKVLNLLIVIVATVLIPLMLFQFTTSKRAIDVFYALPIRKEALFGVNYLTGIIMLLVPYLISTVTGILMAAGLGMQGIVWHIELVNFLVASLTLLVSYSITMLAKQNCGTIIDAFLYTIALNLIPLLAYLSYYMFCEQLLLGFNEPFSNDIFYYLTPFPAMFIYALRDNINIHSEVPNAAIWFYLIFVPVVYVINSSLYLKHKSERADTPFMNRYFYPIVSFVSTIIAIIFIHTVMNGMFNYGGISTYVFPLLVGAVFYIILDIIANRGFKQLQKTLLRFVFISIIVLVMIAPTRVTNGFGYVTRIPDLNNVDEVTITLDYPLRQYLGYSEYGNSQVTFTDPQHIAIVHQLHQEILAQYKSIGYEKKNTNTLLYPNNQYEYNYVSTIDLSYDLGLTKLNRRYQVSMEWLSPILQLAGTDPMIDAIYPMVVNPDKYVVKFISLVDPLDTEKQLIFNQLMSKSWDIKDFMEAIERDLKQDEYAADDALLGYVRIVIPTNYGSTYDTNVAVKQSYQNTLAFIKSNGLAFPTSDMNDFKQSNFVLVYPDENEKRFSFFWSSDQNVVLKDNLNRFSYRNVTLEEFSQLVPLVHHTPQTTEPNMLLFVQSTSGEVKTYSIRYKDMAVVNTIVKDEIKTTTTYIYDLLYDKGTQ